MVATRHTQSLKDFRQNATETLERINRTGEAEVIPVNGEARAVLMLPAAFGATAREMQIVRDVEMMRQSLQQIAEGKFVMLEQMSRQIRAKLEDGLASRERAG